MLNSIYDRVNKVLMSIDPFSTTILKGHLLLEELINEILENHVQHPDIFNEIRIGFYAKLGLARSMSKSRHSSPWWEMIKLINTLRNESAHKLDTKKRDKLMNKMRSYYEESAIVEVDENWLKIKNITYFSFVLNTCYDFLNDELIASK